MYFADLTPYRYTGRTAEAKVLNVGWLSDGHPFAVGESSPEFRSALCELAAEPVNICCGSHQCEFCPRPLWPPLFRDDRSAEITRGSGEIRAPAMSGDVVYVAPQLVAHYVEAHRYLPPVPFVDAVIECARRRRSAVDALHAVWRSRFPPLDGKWTHWRLFSSRMLISVVARDGLSEAIGMVERNRRDRVSVEVSRSYRDRGGDGIVVEPIRHRISEISGENFPAAGDDSLAHRV